MLVVLLHRAVPSGVFWMQLLHNLLHSLTLYYVVDLAFTYFAEKDRRKVERYNRDHS